MLSFRLATFPRFLLRVNNLEVVDCLLIIGIFANVMTLAPLFYAEVLEQNARNSLNSFRINMFGNLIISKLDNFGNVCSKIFEFWGILLFGNSKNEILESRKCESRNAGTL